MSSGVLAPLSGDPSALARAACRLGEVAQGVARERAGFTCGAGEVAVSVMHSDSAFRLTELARGVRGVEGEIAAVERGGAAVARALEQHAADWQRLEDQLDGWRADVARADRAAAAAGAPGSSPEADTAHQLARITRANAEEDARRAKVVLLQRRDELAAMVNAETAMLDPTWAVISPDSIRGASLVGRGSGKDPWGQLASAWGYVAAEDVRREKATFGYPAEGALAGFGEGVEGTVDGLRDTVLHPADTLTAAWALGVDLTVHPVSTRVALWHHLVDPYVEDWRTGAQGHAMGSAAWQGIELLIGAKGLTKAGALGGDLRDAASALRVARAARLADLRIARERHGHLTSNAIQVGLTHYLFRDEREACWALAHPLPFTTYRVEYEGLPTDYHLDGDGRLAVIRGPKTLRRASTPVVPDKAYEMRDRLKANDWKKVDNYYGGKPFKNKPGPQKDTARLPAYDSSGAAVTYREFDIHPLTPNVNRGLERILRGSDGRAWYTDDHYKTFVEVR